LERHEAIQLLGKRLHNRMEHLDPSLGDDGWEALSEREREFYRLCVEDMLAASDLCRIGLGDANEDSVNRQPMLRGSAVSE